MEQLQHTTDLLNDSALLWESASQNLILSLGEDTLKRWFKNAYCVHFEEGCALVAVDSETHVLWIESNFSDELNQAFELSLGLPCVVKLVARKKTVEKVETKRTPRESKATSSPTVSEKTFETAAKKCGLNVEKNFKNFIVGANNQFAHAACRGVTAGASRGYNPLFIHSSPGLGKTHLMQALGQEIIKSDDKKRVAYLTGEKFTNKFIEAVRKGSLEAFRKRYRKVDVLIIDDIQFIAGKEKSQEEFFHTFNTLLEGQGQIVLASDRPATEIQTFDSRLVSRFEQGLTVSLTPPEFETRVAILQSKMKELDAHVPEIAVHFIAQRVTKNVRRLEGALIRVATYCSLNKTELTDSILEDLLVDVLREENITKVTVELIQKTVAEHYDIRFSDMSSRRRPANIAIPRQIAMFLCRQFTMNSLAEIGEAFGGRDHGTVIHACKKTEQAFQQDERTKREINYIKSKLVRAH